LYRLREWTRLGVYLPSDVLPSFFTQPVFINDLIESDKQLVQVAGVPKLSILPATNNLVCAMENYTQRIDT
jgi:hypothetical protein